MEDRRRSGLWVESSNNGDDAHYTRRQNGPFEYYQPPAGHAKGRSFSERTGGSRPTHVQDQSQGLKLQPMVSPPLKYEDLHHGAERYPDLVPQKLASPSYGNTTGMPLPRPIKQQRPVRTEAGDEDVPDNMRSKPWSPEPLPLNTQKPSRYSSNPAKPARRGSVPDRSPLQKLEYDISKEEKRARMKEAEDRTRRKEPRKSSLPAEGDMLRSGTMRGENARVVSDGAQNSSQRDARHGMGRHASTGLSLIHI